MMEIAIAILTTFCGVASLAVAWMGFSLSKHRGTKKDQIEETTKLVTISNTVNNIESMVTEMRSENAETKKEMSAMFERVIILEEKTKNMEGKVNDIYHICYGDNFSDLHGSKTSV